MVTCYRSSCLRFSVRAHLHSRFLSVWFSFSFGHHYQEHEAFGRGKLLISLQFDKSVCNNQISLLLQNVFVWLLMWSGAFFARLHQPNKAVVDFNVLVSLTVYDGSFSNFNAVNQFLNDFPVQFLQVQILPDGSGPLVDIGDVLLGFPFPG